MQTVELQRRERQRLVERTAMAEASAREEALSRLVDLLEAETPVSEDEHRHLVERQTDALSQLARLRKAHASYALANMSSMKRVGAGAWIRRRRE